MSAPKTVTRELPEHERLALVKDKSQEIGGFLEWLSEQHIELAKYHVHSESCLSSNQDPHDLWGGYDCGFSEDKLYPHHERIENLLARFYDIDLNKLEREKRQILADIRKQSAGEKIDKELGL